jgi:hypothetical protein
MAVEKTAHLKRNFMICTLHRIILCKRVMKSSRMSWVGHVAYARKRTGAYRIMVGKPEGKRSLGMQ